MSVRRMHFPPCAAVLLLHSKPALPLRPISFSSYHSPGSFKARNISLGRDLGKPRLTTRSPKPNAALPTSSSSGAPVGVGARPLTTALEFLVRQPPPPWCTMAPGFLRLARRSSRFDLDFEKNRERSREIDRQLRIHAKELGREFKVLLLGLSP